MKVGHLPTVPKCLAHMASMGHRVNTGGGFEVKAVSIQDSTPREERVAEHLAHLWPGAGNRGVSKR